MKSIFAQHDVKHELTVVNGQGLSIVVNQASVFWRPVFEALKNPTSHTELRITSWLSSGAKEHPLLRDYDVPGFNLVPRPSDRLISTVVIPANIPIEATVIDDPEKGYEFDALAIKLIIGNRGRHEEKTTCNRVRIFPCTGELQIITG